MWTQEEFEKCCQSLSKTERNILFLYLQGMSPMAIVDCTDYSENTVSKRLAGACRRFGFEKPDGTYYQEVRKAVVDLFVRFAPEHVNHEYFGYEAPKLEKITDGSVLYVARPAIERICFNAISQASGLLRIKAPTSFGKTTLLNRLLTQAEKEGYKTVNLSFEFADESVLGHLETFSKWFCAVMSHELEQPNQIDEVWKDIYACNFNTTSYFEKFLLPGQEKPILLALDDTDLVFEQAAINNDFCKLMRGWNNKSGGSPLWKKLRVVLVHSTEIYGSLDINTSPLANVGTVVDLPELNLYQTGLLAQQNGISLSQDQIKDLTALVGGHPLLLQIGFNNLGQGLSLPQLLENAHTESGIYSSYLRQQLVILGKNPALISGFNEIIQYPSPIQVDSNVTFQLFGMGLITLDGDLASPRNELYRRYFQSRL